MTKSQVLIKQGCAVAQLGAVNVVMTICLQPWRSCLQITIPCWLLGFTGPITGHATVTTILKQSPCFVLLVPGADRH